VIERPTGNQQGVRASSHLLRFAAVVMLSVVITSCSDGSENQATTAKRLEALLEKGELVTLPLDPKNVQSDFVQKIQRCMENNVDLWVKAGADVNWADENGRSLLSYATNCPNADTVQALLSRGANANSRDKAGITPLFWATASLSAETSGTAVLDIARQLISKGADVNAKAREGHTPLHGAAFDGHLALVELLIEKGADINAPSSEGTPLDIATRKGHDQVARVLVAKGARHSR